MKTVKNKKKQRILTFKKALSRRVFVHFCFVDNFKQTTTDSFSTKPNSEPYMSFRDEVVDPIQPWHWYLHTTIDGQRSPSTWVCVSEHSVPPHRCGRTSPKADTENVTVSLFTESQKYRLLIP